MADYARVAQVSALVVAKATNKHDIPVSTDGVTESSIPVFVDDRWRYSRVMYDGVVGVNTEYTIDISVLGTQRCRVEVYWRATETATTEWKCPCLWAEGGSGSADWSWDDGAAAGYWTWFYDNSTLYIHTGRDGTFKYQRSADGGVETGGYYRVLVWPVEIET